MRTRLEGGALPVELRRQLLVNNGAAEFDAAGTYHREAAFSPGGHRLLSAERLARESRDLADIAADSMAIDQRPGPGQGAVGEFDHEGSTEFTIGGSLGEYVAKAADSIENGTDFLYFRLLVEDGGLDWTFIVEENQDED